MRRRARPVGRCRLQLRQRCLCVHRRDRLVEQQLVRDLREASVGERLRERAVLLEHVRRLLRADARRPGILSDGSPRSAMKSGTCSGSTPYRSRTSGTPIRASSETPLTGCRIETRSDDELVRVAVGGDDRHRPRPRVRGGGEEVVRLVAARLADLEAERLAELGQPPELLEQRVLELAPRLVGRQRLVAVRRRLERVPADEHRLRPLGIPEPHQEPREADERVRRPAVALDRLRDRVVGAVCERVAVDREERAAHSESSSSRIDAITRSVATRAASAGSSSSRSSSWTGAP